jgi:ABC-type transport system involved in cytochrome c biogenesis permease component
MWPVILRELRAGSRRWTTYGLRLLSTAALILCILFWFANDRSSPRAGADLFGWMHVIILAAIWILVPLMTCDCLSREKREGTLGLLFLTNLRAREIVLAKAVAHAITALTLWLATVPLVAVPMLLGGLDWREVFLSSSLAFGSICGALGAGLLASTLARRMNGAVIYAVILTPITGIVFALIMMSLHETCAFLFGAIVARELTDIFSMSGVQIAMGFLCNSEDLWSDTLNKAGGISKAVLIGSSLLVPIAALALLLVCRWIVAPIVQRTWQDKPKTKQQTEVEKFFCAPSFFPKLFRRWMRRSLERNPIGWLEKRSWSGRIAALIWLAVMVSFASTAVSFGNFFRGDGMSMLNGLMWMLLASTAYVAAGSFRRERETGALELILITPLSESAIVSGRLRGIWSQFLPALAIWTAVVFYVYSWNKNWHPWNVIQFTVYYFIVPVVGLYFSLRSRIVLLSWGATLAVCVALPQVMWWVFRSTALEIVAFTMGDVLHMVIYSALSFLLRFPQCMLVLAQLSLAAFFLWRLRVNLARRSFSLR